MADVKSIIELSVSNYCICNPTFISNYMLLVYSKSQLSFRHHIFHLYCVNSNIYCVNK